MTTPTPAPRSPDHLLARFEHELPFHALPRLIRRPGNLLERLVQRQVVSDRVLRRNQRRVVTADHAQGGERTCQPVAGLSL